VNLCLAAVEK